MTEQTPFGIERYDIDGHTILIESYHDGGPGYQRNGSGSYNARKHTRWEVSIEGTTMRWTMHSRFGHTKWGSYETARQRIARTPDAYRSRDPVTKQITGYTRWGHTVRAEMRTVKR